MSKIPHKILITSALPYANGPIHIGHLVEYIQTDIIVRFLKSVGKDVIYICASDTHGTPIEVNAAKLGMTPEQLVRKFNKEHKQDFDSFHIQFDSYYTTHSKENKELSEQFFLTLKKKGYIYTKTINVIFCAKCSRALPDRYVRGTCPHCATEDQYGDVCESCGVALKGVDLINPKCSLCSSTPEQRESLHYFFKLSAFAGKLKKWLDKNKNLQPEIKNHIYGWLKKGLEDWNISRDGPYFGFNIPGEKNKYFYVWLDAPIGYISSTKHYTKRWQDYWVAKGRESEIVHFIGKDIIYFHFLFWPAMLMGAGFTLPSDIVVHGFLTVNGEKMSKSRGTFFTAQDFLKLYQPEHLRFYYAQHLSKKLMDVDLDFENFHATINNKLIANVANFCYRVLSFAEKNYDGKLDEIASDNIVKEIKVRVENAKRRYAEYDIKGALVEALATSDLGNAYFQKTEPWKDKVNGKKSVGLAANMVRVLSIVLQPILPVFSMEIQKQLGEKSLQWKDIAFDKKLKIKNAKIVYTKIEHLPKKMTFPLNLRIGEIIAVKDHPDADSLYVMEVDVGEKRQLVAGVKRYYKKDELKGKHVVVCVNMKPAKIRGVESKGMLLAAEDDAGHVAVLEAPKSKPGQAATMEGYENSPKEITFEEFMKLGLKFIDGKIVWNKAHLHTEIEDVMVAGVLSGAVVR
ncbi:methionine--tRNA ligase [Candidatus Woesearchaeota archaeon]|nr:methionine--tRNA ligase [Candidatus Woesearchaeota archaeon]